MSEEFSRIMSNAREMLDEWLAALGEMLDGSPWLLSPAGYCTLEHSGIEIVLEYLEDEERVAIYGRLGVSVEEIDRQVLQELLTANFLGQTTGGAGLAAHPEHGWLVIGIVLPIAILSVDRLESILLGIREQSVCWKAKLAVLRESGLSVPEKHIGLFV